MFTKTNIFVYSLMNLRIKLLFIASFLFCDLSAQNNIGQMNNRIIFNHLGANGELNYSNVTAIVKDDLGFIWLATENGLCKYDGTSFIFFRHDPDDTTSIENNKITSIVKDKKGILWFGVDGAGLYSLDPISEKLTLHKNYVNSLGTNKIFDVFPGTDDKIWLATYGGGLCLFDERTEKFTNYFHSETDKNSISDNRVFQVYEDEYGKIWVAMKYKGLDELDTKTGKFTHHNFLNATENELMNYFADYRHSYFITTTSKGVVKFWPKSNKIERFNNSNAPSLLKEMNKLSRVFVDSKHRVFIGSEHGVILIMDAENNSFTPFKHIGDDDLSPSDNDRKNNFYEDEQGSIWIANGYTGSGTGHFGMDIIYPKTIDAVTIHHDPSTNNSLISDDVNSIFEDMDGKLWIGTYGAGMSRFDRKSGVFTNYGTDHFGPMHEKKENWDKTTISDGLIYNFYQTADGYLWICTEDGLNKFNILTGKVENLWLQETHLPDQAPAYEKRTHRVCKIYEDGKGNLWVATIGGGLLNFNPGTGKFRRYRHDDKDSSSISDNRIFDCAMDKKNNILWIGTVGGGLSAFDLNTHKFFNCRYKKNNLNSISFDCILKTSIDTLNNILWIGTSGVGLNALNLNHLPADKNKLHFFHFTDKDGLPDNDVMNIIPDGKGNIWLTTARSLCFFTPPSSLGGILKDKNFPKGILKVYHITDGIPFEGSAQYSCLLSAVDKKIYIGGNGLYSFYPDSILQNNFVPKVFITGLKLFDKAINADSSVLIKKNFVFSYNENFISFTFAALNYIFPEKNRFAYKLEGVDHDWNYCGNRNSASYTALPPGTYTFRVKAANNDGYWNEQGNYIRITIQPPFWKTKWFYTLCILLLIIGIVTFIRYRERKLKLEKKVLEETVEVRTLDLRKAYMQIEERNKDITDSINYAKRIQEAILPAKKLKYKIFPDAFILFQPRDIVSGDFYWFTEKKGKKIIAAVDCTGHGVPGAFMSMIGNAFLNEIVNERGIIKPAEILNELRTLVVTSLKQNDNENKDGMDIALICLDEKNDSVEFAGANNPLWIIRKNGSLEEIKADKQPAGSYKGEANAFTNHEIEIMKGDTLYIFTDGFADQFGGPKGKKFKSKQLQALLFSVINESMRAQEKILAETFNSWKSELEQVDDVLVIGVKV